VNNLNASGFKSFFIAWYDKSLLFAKSYVHDDLAAEDIAAEALAELWKTIHLKGEVENPKPLLFILLKHLSLDYLKHEVVKQNVHDLLADYSAKELEIRISTLEACEPEKVYEADIQNIIQTTLDSLPEQTRLIFKMNRVEHIQKKEIAEQLGMTIKGVDYHLYKALNSLRENLKDYYPLVLFFFF
jgi:RNA polymerase sigma-70 factor (ECF subfamily)